MYFTRIFDTEEHFEWFENNRADHTKDIGIHRKDGKIICTYKDYSEGYSNLMKDGIKESDYQKQTA